MLTGTYDYLAELDFVRGEAQVDHKKLADAAAGLLQETPVTRDRQIQQQGLIVAEIRQRVVGDPDDEDVEHELDQIFVPLTGPFGAVQRALTGGYVLCTARVERTLTNNGQGTVTVKRPGRFATKDPGLIERYFLAPGQLRIIRAAQRFNQQLELSVSRVPRLAARRMPLLEQTITLVGEELPLEEEES